MIRRGNIFYRDKFAGIIEQNEDGFIFTYNDEYLNSGNPPVSLTLPLRKEPFVSKFMIPFFDGLIPEGWLLELTEKKWKIDRRDRMGLLLTACKDCIGAISVIREDI